MGLLCKHTVDRQTAESVFTSAVFYFLAAERLAVKIFYLLIVKIYTYITNDTIFV